MFSLAIEGCEIPPEWVSLSKDLQDGRIIFVLGASDTGKTTLIKFLIDRFVRSGKKVAIVDSDIGQSSIAVPTVISSALISSADDIKSPKVHSLFFIGSTSPPGNLLQMAVGLKKTVEAALLTKPDLVVVDTTGFIHGATALELKYQKVSLVQPTHIVTIQREREAEPILGSVRASFDNLKILRLKPGSSVMGRSLDERQANRERKFAEYFSGAKKLKIKIGDVSLRRGPFGVGLPISDLKLYELSKTSGLDLLYGEEGNEEAVLVVRSMGHSDSLLNKIQSYLKKRLVRVINQSELEGAVVGLGMRAQGGFVSGLGIILGVEEGVVNVFTPVMDSSRIGVVIFGSLKISTSGRETGKLTFY
jgi:polynucleotide 5'-hydroxyl-kinase GRC3/NOL9